MRLERRQHHHLSAVQIARRDADLITAIYALAVQGSMAVGSFAFGVLAHIGVSRSLLVAGFVATTGLLLALVGCHCTADQSAASLCDQFGQLQPAVLGAGHIVLQLPQLRGQPGDADMVGLVVLGQLDMLGVDPVGQFGQRDPGRRSPSACATRRLTEGWIGADGPRRPWRLGRRADATRSQVLVDAAGQMTQVVVEGRRTADR